MRAPRLRRPPAIDAVLAIGLAVLVLGGEIYGSDVESNQAVLVPTALAMTLPLAWRRIAPLGAVTVMMAALAAEGALDRGGLEPQTPLIALLIAVFSVGSHAPAREARIGLGITLVALLVREPGDMIVMGPLFAGAWAAGRLLQARQRDVAASEHRAADLERERDEARRSVEEERGRIARELHDVVAHNVSVIVMQAGAERLARQEAPESTRQTLESIERTGREALVEMQRLLGVLRSDDAGIALAPQPSLTQLGTLATHVTDAGLPVELEIEGEPVELPPGIDISAYRIVQEALTNALKHAGPARARVTVRYEREQLEIEVADDGRGAAGANGGGGHGLVGMRERVAIYGGELRAGAGVAGGFRVQACLPLEEPRP